MGSRSIDDEERRDPLAAWRALRPDQRGSVYDALAQAALLVRTDLLKRTQMIESCPDLDATCLDTGEAIGCAVRALREIGSPLDDQQIDRVRPLLAAVSTMSGAERLDFAQWLRAGGFVATPRGIAVRALADLVDPEGE